MPQPIGRHLVDRRGAPARMKVVRLRAEPAARKEAELADRLLALVIRLDERHHLQQLGVFHRQRRQDPSSVRQVLRVELSDLTHRRRP